MGVRGWLMIPKIGDIEHYIHMKQKRRQKKELCKIVFFLVTNGFFKNF